jgi:hypothetical protein
MIETLLQHHQLKLVSENLSRVGVYLETKMHFVASTDPFRCQHETLDIPERLTTYMRIPALGEVNLFQIIHVGTFQILYNRHLSLGGINRSATGRTSGSGGSGGSSRSSRSGGGWDRTNTSRRTNRTNGTNKLKPLTTSSAELLAGGICSAAIRTLNHLLLLHHNL